MPARLRRAGFLDAKFSGVAADGAGAGSGGGGIVRRIPAGSVWLTKSDESRPQLGQTNFTGFCSISGVASKAYFAPQEHWIFMCA